MKFNFIPISSLLAIIDVKNDVKRVSSTLPPHNQVVSLPRLSRPSLRKKLRLIGVIRGLAGQTA